MFVKEIDASALKARIDAGEDIALIDLPDYPDGKLRSWL